MNFDIKKQKKIISSMKKDIKNINFKLKYKNVEKIKNEIKRRGKITFCKGRLFAPFAIALGISVGTFSCCGATPFLLDGKKDYQKTMKEIDASGHIRSIQQYEDYETTDNVLYFYDNWQTIDGNTFFRIIKVYKLGDISEFRIKEILNGNVCSLDDVFGGPISIKTETSNYLEKSELDQKPFLKARIFSEDTNEYIYVNQPISDNIGETILWAFILLFLESIAFVYRGFSSFNCNKTIKKINNKYSIDKEEMLKKRLAILETSYNIMNSYSDIEIDENFVSKYLSCKDNNMLSKLSMEELKKVLIIATELKLSLRKNLGFSDNYTYGTEIELENVKSQEIIKKLSKYKLSGWELKKDYSLHNGVEIVSPILYDKEEYWKELNNVCEDTKNIAFIDKCSSSHVHVGAHILGKNKKAWLNFVKLWAVYENIIFRFAYGEFYNYRDNIMDYSQPISNSLWKDYLFLKGKDADLDEIIETIKYGKYFAINFSHVKLEHCDEIISGNTIEIRCGNGSDKAIIWQNNINLYLLLFKYATSDKFNDEILDLRHSKCEGIYENIDMYGEIYLDQSIELCDLLFDNNQDKLFFLNQYLKSFKVSKKNFDKNKTFMKK